MKFGIIHNESISEYHNSEAVSSTRLMDLRPCPQFYYMRHIAKTLPREDKKEFDVGNAAHWLILEGRAALEERTVLQPATYPPSPKLHNVIPCAEKPWHNGANYCKDWVKAQAGKVILATDDFTTIDRMAAAVGENPDAMALLSGGESEVTFRVQHPAFAVQCRPDHWKDSRTMGLRKICVHLKTCDSIERFKADYFRFRFYYMAAFYEDVIEQLVGERPWSPFVALEKSAPWRCEVFEPSESDLELGRAEVLTDLQTLRRCMESGKWEGSKPGIQRIELTSWQRKLAEANGAALWEEASA